MCKRKEKIKPTSKRITTTTIQDKIQTTKNYVPEKVASSTLQTDLLTNANETSDLSPILA